MLFNIIEKSKVNSTNLCDKLQFVNSVKRLVFDLTKIPFLERLRGIFCLIPEVLDDQNLFTESNLAKWFSSFVQFCSSGHFPERAEAARQCGKMNHLNPILPGGGRILPPLRFFCSTVQTATAIAMIFGDF